MTTIMLADDHDIVRKGLHAIINEQEDMEIVAEVSTGRDAVEKALECKPDVIIMDISMPDLNGIEATHQIRRELPDTRVLVLSMHHRRQFILDVLRAGACGYVVKEDICQDLVKAIRAAIEGGTYLSPRVATLVVSDFLEKSEKGTTRSASALSHREREVLQLIAEGRSTKQIAPHLHISIKTVESTRRRIMQKLDLHSVAELTKFAIGEGLTTLTY